MTSPALATIGDNSTHLWGMTNAERVRRISQAQGFDEQGPTIILAHLDYAFDPMWTTYLKSRPGTVVTRNGRPVLAHVGEVEANEAAALMLAGRRLPGLTIVQAEDEAGILNEALRKRERPFMEPLTPDTVPAIERLSYRGAYKGVTDVLTKYLWPEWAFRLTQLSARIGISPNGITAIGSVLCIVATVAFWYGWFWTGLATGLVFMVLDTVDGKLARCTITSSKLGNAWDHGVDLVHPPFWWWAWAAGCAPYGRALSDETFWIVIGTMLFGYVAQRLIEGAFIVRFGMHIHVWQKFDSDFRLVTARRNPNMVILLAGLLVGRPDWGIIGVAAWTAISLVVHLVRLLQAMAVKRAGVAMVSWLA
ncbi:phosphatidylglycerophosphate synthase [Sphingomonas sp. Leaf339]|uniref:CDP-alcohol phosphatidyltransferase family protein n=1 Tax=Sphingomonas sp. Leaf339 TaxID=1736343 RepID=UPI0006F817BE|nr:CDP-alcohol phosphatidyltransferase family protein [Sphingomonas sp. Leaf339]KQU61989.1 phosphatidylglycerophosphate synthase [Sphingomonas sp. Leaf339]